MQITKAIVYTANGLKLVHTRLPGPRRPIETSSHGVRADLKAFCRLLYYEVLLISFTFSMVSLA
jgi:hypothetical protein